MVRHLGSVSQFDHANPDALREAGGFKFDRLRNSRRGCLMTAITKGHVGHSRRDFWQDAAGLPWATEQGRPCQLAAWYDSVPAFDIESPIVGEFNRRCHCFLGRL